MAVGTEIYTVFILCRIADARDVAGAEYMRETVIAIHRTERKLLQLDFPVPVQVFAAFRHLELILRCYCSGKKRVVVVRSMGHIRLPGLRQCLQKREIPQKQRIGEICFSVPNKRPILVPTKEHIGVVLPA